MSKEIRLEFRYIEPPKLSTGQEPTKQQKTKQKRKKFAPFCDIIESPQNKKERGRFLCTKIISQDKLL